MTAMVHQQSLPLRAECPTGSGSFCHWHDHSAWNASSGKRNPTPSRLHDHYGQPQKGTALSPTQRHVAQSVANCAALTHNRDKAYDKCRLKPLRRHKRRPQGATGILPVRSAAKDCSPVELASGLKEKAKCSRLAHGTQSVCTTVKRISP